MLVVAVAATIVSAVRAPADLEAGSPEAVVQRYLRAIADADRDTLRDLLSPALRERCEREFHGEWPRSAGDAPVFEADLVGIDERSAGAVEVTVRITEFSGEPPFGGSGYDHTEVVVLERLGESWAVTEPTWPYYVCPV